MPWVPLLRIRHFQHVSQSANFKTVSVMDSILHQLSLGTLAESFLNERIDPGVALSMSDSALTDLGVNMIGDRIQLRELCTKYVSNQRQSDEDDGNTAASGTTLSGRDSVRQERSLLFQPNNTAGRSASS